ncbi:ABC transporter permease [Haliangium ochraceum]|uniref:Binding-protein-dependent transport systems inner membrane component n=1 Tax=Haliangium ochraceum (strain DSM 14365 / JCM 11303 / SMP-2) TaxID=502025 RepID=D0LZG9_HALO1|nr:proline/glycine betaine ABC transporter permease [Haliangium ochraceum]ACY17948.1 binding-protein-dependent transport systems inner membrane component [Haliangium ochraceum DSM 14365]
MIELRVGDFFENIIEWLRENFEGVFDAIGAAITTGVDVFKAGLHLPPSWVLVLVFALIAWRMSGIGMGIFTLLGMLLIDSMGLWAPTMDTLALVIASVVIALLISVPIGIWASKSDTAAHVVRPVLDFMQTLPAFVYLIPAVLFFQLGEVPGVIATLIFAMPPAVRLTNLGIRQVPKDIKEAAVSFGSTPSQMLFKAELPVAMPTILAGVNQTIMLALSMVVITGMIGAGGLGNQVLKGITQLQIGLGFESGIAIVILAIFLDRITQSLGQPRSQRRARKA